MDRKTDQLFDSETVPGQSYLQDIIQSIIIPQRHQYAQNFMFMDDSIPPDCACVVNVHLQHVGVPHMEYLSMSPDLNPIQHLWDMFKYCCQSLSGLNC